VAPVPCAFWKKRTVVDSCAPRYVAAPTQAPFSVAPPVTEEGDSVRMKDGSEQPLRINVSAVRVTNLSISFVV
jgi:hypothetical protein